ncbi:MAG: hypothetical protein ACRD23_10125 [Terriglobales bacterium]
MRFAVRQLPALGLALISWSATGQNPSAKPLSPMLSGLGQLTRGSGYIFDGTVMSVEPMAQDQTNGVAMVQITFRVEQAIRGVRGGQVLVIREWAGLWNSGERYRRGERLLLFLYSPSKLGLTSAVGGPLGRFTVDSGGNAVFEKGRLPALSFDPASQAQLRQKNRVNARALALAIQRQDPE